MNELNTKKASNNYDPPYTTCPDCGRDINNANTGGNGFCSECAPNH